MPASPPRFERSRSATPERGTNPSSLDAPVSNQELPSDQVISDPRSDPHSVENNNTRSSDSDHRLLALPAVVIEAGTADTPEESAPGAATEPPKRTESGVAQDIGSSTGAIPKKSKAVPPPPPSKESDQNNERAELRGLKAIISDIFLQYFLNYY